MSDRFAKLPVNEYLRKKFLFWDNEHPRNQRKIINAMFQIYRDVLN